MNSDVKTVTFSVIYVITTILDLELKKVIEAEDRICFNDIVDI